MNGADITTNATFCATFVDQLVTDGLTTACVAPGSRSTPLALAFLADGRVTTEVFHDERSAAFAALGHGLATGLPAAVLCTSGTAAAHFYAAVIEADLSSVPLLACTADRPAELHGRGAPQTIDQADLYGTHVRAFVAPAPPDEIDPRRWRQVARDAWLGSTGATPGPVHLNLAFRDPLTGMAGPLPSPLDPIAPRRVSAPATGAVEDLVAGVKNRRGVIIAGRGETPAAAALGLAERLAWPILADHRSGCRVPGAQNVIHRYDSLLRHDPFAVAFRPDIVLRLGEIVSSKAVSLWLSSLGSDGTAVLAGRPHGRYIDPEDVATSGFDERGIIEAVLDLLDPADAAPADWLASWRDADDRAWSAVARIVDGPDSRPSEVGVASETIRAVPAGGALVVASSMPVRDLEWFAPPRDDIAVIANRGANGIDGTLATAIGVAMTGRATICLVGDVAMVHDATSLTALAQRDLDLTVVVIDNDGGGIFSFLPQHELLDTQRYEQLFGTPHGTDIAALVAAHGLSVQAWPAALEPASVRFVVARFDRAENVTFHHRLHQAVAEALAI